MRLKNSQLALFAGFLVAYLILGRLGLSLAFFNSSTSPVWPPTGLSLAAVLLIGYRIWPAIALGAFLLNWMNSGSIPISIAISAGNTIEAVLGGLLVRRFAGGQDCFEESANVWKYFLLAGAFATSICALWGSLALYFGGLAKAADFGAVFVTWWLGDLASNMIIAPFLITMARKSRSKLTPRKILWGLPYAIAALSSIMIFYAWPGQSEAAGSTLKYLTLPIVVWVAFQCGQRCVAGVILLTSGIAVIGTLDGVGAFAMSTPNASLMMLQAFMCALSLTGLPLCAVLAERRKAAEALSRAQKELAVRFRRQTSKLITAQKAHRQLDEALQKNEERYRQLVELSPDGIFIQCEEVFVFANSAMASILGAENSRELLGRKVMDFVHPDHRQAVLDRNRLLIDQREMVPLIEKRLIRLDGRVVAVEATAAPYVHQGKAAAQVVIRDITRRKRLEEQIKQAQKMKALGQLAGGIAHDFNNVLASMIGYARLAMGVLPDGSPVRDDLKQLLLAGAHGRDLAGRILMFSRESGITEKRVPSKLETLANETVKMLRPTLPSTIQIRLDVAPGLPCAKVDPAQIRQVIANLCINSSQAMPDGGTLTIMLRKRQMERPSQVMLTGDSKNGQILKPGEYLVMTVKDTGHGISHEILPHIFEPFFTTKNLHESAGMGLSVVYGIVQGNEGTIQVRSEVGKGTSFEIFLPACAERVSEISRMVETVRGGEESILVLDDEELVANMMGKTLKRLGYRVSVRYRPSAALELLKSGSEHFHLAVIDHTMPEMTGDKLAEEIHRLRPGLPIIICTGYGPNLRRSRVGIFSVKALLKKPFDDDELELTVRRILDEMASPASV